LYSIDPDIKPGVRIKAQQPVGIQGKEGGSGGWSHLHFEIQGLQPSGRWGTAEDYAFLWEAYQHEYHPDLIVVARPHHVAWAGNTVARDAETCIYLIWTNL
jgi:murein DD-endopeptidase MepM/ murein hydrolase activator NlpD